MSLAPILLVFFQAPAVPAGLSVVVSDGQDDFRLLAKPGHEPQLRFAGTTTAFDIVGSPVVQKNSSGYQLVSHRISGKYASQPDHTYRFDEFHATGDAVMNYDTRIASAFARITDPTLLAVWSSSVLRSDTIDVTLKENVATAVLKSAFTLDDSRQSNPADGLTLQVSTVKGSSGSFRFQVPQTSKKGEAKGKPERAKLIDGEANGPVQFHSVVTVQEVHHLFFFGHVVLYTVPTRKTYDIVGDHLLVDMSKEEGKVVLSGHVKYRYSVDDMQGIADEVIATIGKNGDVIAIETKGVPEMAAPTAKNGAQA